MDNSKNRHNNDHLGVNKIGKNIRKSPLHQPNFAPNVNSNNINNNNAARQQPQPQVYNISKNDFRNIVQQLTGSPSQDPLPRPPNNPPKSQSMRLQKIRPPPLTPFNRPHMPPPAQVPVGPPQVPYNNSFARPPPPPPQYAQPPPAQLPPIAPADPYFHNTNESPISQYMRYLQTSLMDPSPVGNPPVPPPQGYIPGHPHGPPPPASALLPSPRTNGPMPPVPPNLHPSQMGGPALLPSPTSQFLLPSPSNYLNLSSPRSPYPLLSPGMQFPPLTPNFSFSPLAQSGILGPGPQPPPSPGLAFPLSPWGFFAMPSPRWRDQ